MSDPPGDALPTRDVLERIAILAESLCGHPEVGDEVAELLDWVDAFHREGLERLVAMIRTWRGEIFLEAVAADEVAGMLLDAYDLAGVEPAEPSSVSVPLPSRRAAPSSPLLQIRGHEPS